MTALVSRADLRQAAVLIRDAANQLALHDMDLGAAPLPLGDREADRHSLKLRTLGFSYQQIATVMRLYHGHDHTADTWRKRLRQLGTPAKIHGRPFGSAP